MKAGQTTVEGHTERRTLVPPMRRAPGPTRDLSPRQLPTDDDHDGGRQARSANISVINRRHEPLDRLLPCRNAKQQRTQRKEKKKRSVLVLTGRSISGGH